MKNKGRAGRKIPEKGCHPGGSPRGLCPEGVSRHCDLDDRQESQQAEVTIYEYSENKENLLFSIPAKKKEAFDLP